MRVSVLAGGGWTRRTGGGRAVSAPRFSFVERRRRWNLSNSAPRRQGPKRILLADCDAFFVQVARLEDPEGAGREPFLLVGGPGPRGVVASASYRARAKGVRSAMPTATAKRLCPEAVVVPVPRAACVERSRAVRRVLSEHAPVVQAASIDEFYLDMTGTERMLGGEGLARTAGRIRRAVRDGAGVGVSVGGGSQRVVAKMAAGVAKPGGVHVVPPGGEAAFMARFDLRELPGVGPAFAAQLERRGLRTVAETAAVEMAWLARWFGEGRGRWLWERVRGIDPSEVAAGDRRKSVSSERTFIEDVRDDDELERRLLALCCAVGRQLRAQELRARTVTVKVRDADFKTRQAGSTQPEGVETDRGLFAIASSLLRDLRNRRRTGVRLVGVGASNLVRQAEGRQAELFGRPSGGESEKDRDATRAADRVRARYGRDALAPARVLEKPPGTG